MQFKINPRAEMMSIVHLTDSPANGLEWLIRQSVNYKGTKMAFM
jgi:hypothetical protein